ncbi:NAD(P)/FAD-dependent oxidoreductase [Nocardiopsis nanhaiensis]
MTRSAVVVGTSVAGVRTAQSLRTSGYSGEVVLVGEEPHPPYDRPPLSKDFLVDAAEPAPTPLLTPEEAQQAGITLLSGTRACRLDSRNRELELDNGQHLSFDDLVIATGARARPCPWGPVPGVHTLRTLEDAKALRRDLRRGGHLVIVGGGFVGMEVASSARALGIDTTIVDPLTLPMSRALGRASGTALSRMHRDRGVQTRFGVGVSAIDREGSELTVHLTDGSALAAKTVLVSIGAEPNVGWLKGSGIQVEDGVVCDSYGRARGADAVYAVGDAAQWFDPGTGAHNRMEHWTNAVEQASCVAHNICTPDEARQHRPSHYVWSDQHAWKIQICGKTGQSQSETTIGPSQEGRFASLYGDSEEGFTGAVTVNWPRAQLLCRRSLYSGVSVADVRRLLEPVPTRTGQGVHA